MGVGTNLAERVGIKKVLQTRLVGSQYLPF
jgi:hypothetical protein